MKTCANLQRYLPASDGVENGPCWSWCLSPPPPVVWVRLPLLVRHQLAVVTPVHGVRHLARYTLPSFLELQKFHSHEKKALVGASTVLVKSSRSFVVSSNLQCAHLWLVVADIPDGVGQLQLQLQLPQRGRHQRGGHRQHAGPGPRPA